MIKFSKIGSVYNVNKYIKSLNRSDEVSEAFKIHEPITYRGTVKLHGTNCGVLCTSSGECLPQSRNRELSLQKDHMGFALFAEKNKEMITKIADDIRSKNLMSTQDIVLYGEWIGPGIQNKVAIENLPEKQWVLFAAREAHKNNEYIDIAKVEFPENDSIFSIFESDIFYITIDFERESSRQSAIEYIEKATESISKKCPWAARFGLEGHGEGIVWMPMDKFWGYSDLMFKSKGEDHKVTKDDKIAKKQKAMDPDTLKSIDDFIDYAVTENRLNQGIDYMNEMQHELDMVNTKHYLKWVADDVCTECADQLVASNLEWKQVAKLVNAKALQFWKQKVNTI